LTPMGLGLAQLSMDDRGEIAAVLSGGQHLAIGGEDFLERMKRFQTVFPAELASQMEQIESIDLRYERGVAVAFRPALENEELISESEKA